MRLRRRRPERPEVPPFLDTPGGILTVTGIRFQTTLELLEEYAGDVLQHVTVEELLARVEIWLRSAQAIAVWVLAVLLFVLHPFVAAAAAILVYIVWEVLSPAFASRRLTFLFKVIEMPIVQAALYVAVLSFLGIRGDLSAVGVGLLGFVLVRWQLLPIALKPLVNGLRRPLYTLPVPDQVLRAFLLRAALRHSVSLPQIDEVRSRSRWVK